MILENTINKLLRDVTNLILATPNYAIAARQKGAPRPRGPYAAVDFMNDTRIGWEQSTLENDSESPDLIETIEGMREIAFSIGFYRDNAIDNARKVRTGVVRQSIQALFNAANLSYIRSSEVREISEAFTHGWEERAQFDIFLSAVATDSDIVAAIETINIAGEFQARGLAYTIDLTNEE